MSFLLPDDDQQATLALALELIDSCGDDYDSSSSSSSLGQSPPPLPSACDSSLTSEPRTTDEENFEDEGDSERDGGKRGESLRVVIRTTANKKLTAAAPSPQTPAAVAAGAHASGTQQAREAPRQPEQKSVVATRLLERNGNAVTRHRARKRAEFASLKAELVALEATLARLQRVQAEKGSALSAQSSQKRFETGAATARENGSLWMDIAVMQARERHESEALNLKLKIAVEKQVKVTRALEAILGRTTKSSKNASPFFYGLDLLSDHQRQGLFNDSLLTPASMVLGGLRACVEEMYQSINNVFGASAPACSVDLVTQTTQMKHDPVTGDPYAELRTNTLMPCSFLESGQLIWNVFASMNEQTAPGYAMRKRSITSTSFEKDYTLKLDVPGGGTVELHGVSFVQKCVEEHRVAYLFASSIATTQAANGPTFREKGWIVFSEASDAKNPLFPSVAQTCQHIFSDQDCAKARESSAGARAFAAGEAAAGKTAGDAGCTTTTGELKQERDEEKVLREFVFAALVSRTQYQYQTIMNFLLANLKNIQPAHSEEERVLKALTC